MDLLNLGDNSVVEGLYQTVRENESPNRTGTFGNKFYIFQEGANGVEYLKISTQHDSQGFGAQPTWSGGPRLAREGLAELSVELIASKLPGLLGFLVNGESLISQFEEGIGDLVDVNRKDLDGLAYFRIVNFEPKEFPKEQRSNEDQSSVLVY